nr:hypothetical protein [Clostridium estertheticum]
MINMFSDNKKHVKKIKKSQNLNDYNEAVLSLFTEQEIIEVLNYLIMNIKYGYLLLRPIVITNLK